MNLLTQTSSLLSIDKEDLYKFIKTSPYRYKIYSIPKRNNKGVRWIAQPSKNLKYLQKILLNEFFKDLPIHQSAVAYVKGLGIKDNAERHCKNQYFLKMDFKDFFPSITPKYFIRHVEEKKGITLNNEDRFIIEKIFFHVTSKSNIHRLSIGAPSSPFISNTIMYDFDCGIKEMCGDDITYTRYADDLIFSTNRKNILYSIPKKIETIINTDFYKFLSINSEKTLFTSKRKKRVVTGLIITNEGKISLGRNKKRYIKSLVHKFSIGDLGPYEMTILTGYIAFLRDVEPDFYDRLIKKYSSQVLENIINSVNSNNE